MKEPGPDHPITLRPAKGEVTVSFNGTVVARSAQAIEMVEANHAPVMYIPVQDVVEGCLAPSDHRSHCPYKGDASYFHLRAGDRVSENAAWSYPQPFPAVAAIRGHLCFYPDRVDSIARGAESP